MLVQFLATDSWGIKKCGWCFRRHLSWAWSKSQLQYHVLQPNVCLSYIIIYDIYDYVLSSEKYQTRELGFHEIEFVWMYSPLRHWQTKTNRILTKTTDSQSFTPDYRWGHIRALVIYLHLARTKIPTAVVLSRDRHMIKMTIIWGQDKNAGLEIRQSSKMYMALIIQDELVHVDHAELFKIHKCSQCWE